jgi:4-aminobutyrate aminotransferase-like enzyme
MRLLKRFRAHLPGGKEEYCLQFCGPSGADATEAAIKLRKLILVAVQ